MKSNDASMKRFFKIKKNELNGFETEFKNEHWWQSYPVSRGEYPFVIEIPNGVRAIKENAFAGLKSGANGKIMIVIGQGVEVLEKCAFSGCEIDKLVISDTVREINQDAFRLSKIGEIEVEKTNPFYKSVDGCLFDYEMSTLIRFSGKTKRQYEIPAGVSIIGKRAFENTPNLECVYVPDTVVSLYDGAFYNSGIRSFNLPADLSMIGQNAFAFCKSLTSFTFPHGATMVNHKLFYGCEALESVSLPETVVTVGKEAFCGCKSLSEIELPDAAVSIGEGAFSGCKSLKLNHFPSGVSSIEACTFKGCEWISEISLPDTLTKIGKEAFSGCKRLASISVPKSVEKIEENAFLGCDRTIKVTLVGRGKKDKLPFDKGWNCLDNTGMIKAKIKNIIFE